MLSARGWLPLEDRLRLALAVFAEVALWVLLRITTFTQLVGVHDIPTHPQAGRQGLASLRFVGGHLLCLLQRGRQSLICRSAPTTPWPARSTTARASLTTMPVTVSIARHPERAGSPRR